MTTENTETNKEKSPFVSREEGAKLRQEKKEENQVNYFTSLKEPAYISFEGSKYDFDEQLKKLGFVQVADSVNNITLGRSFDAEGNDTFLTVYHPRMLYRNVLFDLCSPYTINFSYSPSKNSMIRRIQWDTFPGNDFKFLQQAIELAENEIKTKFLQPNKQTLTK